jgi:DNA-binding NarL/FixJ family response regulator
LLVDDHTLFRKGVASLLQTPGFAVVGEAADGAEAIRQASSLRPDLVLMDLHMPGTDGLHATREITRILPETRVVILTVSEDDRDVFDAIKSGAHGYLLKTVAPAELRELLTGVFRGEAPVSRATAAKILKQFRGREHAVPDTAPTDALTPREHDVLDLLATGLTNKEIGVRLDIAENTVKNHLKNILAKLHLHNRVQAATLATERGVPRRNKPAE